MEIIMQTGLRTQEEEQLLHSEDEYPGSSHTNMIPAAIDIVSYDPGDFG